MPTDPKDCIFCKIVRGEVPSRQVYSDGLVYAFHDIRPAAPVHVLVIPRRHVEMISGLQPEDDALTGGLMRVCGVVAARMGLTGDGYRILVNQGQYAGQQVDHLHLHVLGGRQLGMMG